MLNLNNISFFTNVKNQKFPIEFEMLMNINKFKTRFLSYLTIQMI